MTARTTNWRFVRGFERRYLINHTGQVWSIKQMKMLNSRVAWSHGYLVVSLWDGRKYNRTVHSLVAEAFLGPRPQGHEVRHLNDDRYDNRIENLAYGTHSDNMRDAQRNGRIGGPPPEHDSCDDGYCRACENERRLDRYYRSVGRRRAKQLAAAA